MGVAAAATLDMRSSRQEKILSGTLFMLQQLMLTTHQALQMQEYRDRDKDYCGYSGTERMSDSVNRKRIKWHSVLKTKVHHSMVGIKKVYC